MLSLKFLQDVIARGVDLQKIRREEAPTVKFLFLDGLLYVLDSGFPAHLVDRVLHVLVDYDEGRGEEHDQVEVRRRIDAPGGLVDKEGWDLAGHRDVDEIGEEGAPQDHDRMDAGPVLRVEEDLRIHHEYDIGVKNDAEYPQVRVVAFRVELVIVHTVENSDKNDYRVREPLREPEEEVPHREDRIPLSDVVQLRVQLLEPLVLLDLVDLHLNLPDHVVNVLLKHGAHHHGQGREHDVVERDVERVEDGLPREPVHEGEKELREGENDVLVEEVEDHLRDPDVAPPSVHEHEPPQRLELRQRVVTRLHGAHSLLPVETDPDVRLLDHVHVIGSVPDSQRDLPEPVLHQLHDQRLLHRRCATADDTLALLDDLYQ